MEREEHVRIYLDKLRANEEWEPVPEKWSGESFIDRYPGDTAERLREMKADGLFVPDYAIEALEEEQAEILSKQIAKSKQQPL